MAESIGELFVKLGFVTDDTQLKEFNQKLNGAADGIKNISNIVSTEFAGQVGKSLLDLTLKAGDTATNIRNVALALGDSADNIRKFVSASQIANAAINPEEALQSYAKIAEYIATFTKNPEGASKVFNLLTGKNIQQGWTVADVNRELREAYQSGTMKAINQNPKVLSDRLMELTGNPAYELFLKMSDAELKAAEEKGRISDAEQKNLVQTRADIKELGVEWDNVGTKFAGTIAPALTSVLKEIESFLDYATAKGLGTWLKTAGGEIVDRAADNVPALKTVESWFSLLRPFAGYTPHINASTSSHAAVNGGKADIIKSVLMRHGLSEAQADGAIQRLQEESGLDETNDPRKHGKTENAYGIAQWQVPRQNNYKAWSHGQDIHNSTLEQQAEFLAYEIESGLPKGWADAFKNAKTKREAYSAFTNDIERPAGSTPTINITQNVHGTSDPHATATSALDGLNRIFQTTLFQQTGSQTP